MPSNYKEASDQAVALVAENEKLRENNHRLAEALTKANCELECLHGAGVNNWEGFEYAMQAFAEQYPEG